MSNPLIMRFGSDVESAKSGVASLAVSIASNMTAVSGAALTAGKGVVGFTQGTISSFQSIQRASSLIIPSFAALAMGALATVAAFKAVNAITELGKERLEEYARIAEQAASGGVSPEFLQRSARATDAFRISLDDVAASLEKLKTDTADALGGSAFTRRLNELREAGNFANNSGVSQLSSATSAEERYRAIVSLITQAAQQGERLAALDLAQRFLPPAMMEQLRANSAYLSDMLVSADKLSSTQIVSNDDVARAINLKSRLEDAEKVLSERFKPIQTDLAQLGINYHENWIKIVEGLADAVKWASSLYEQLKQIPDVMAQIGNSSIWGKIGAFTERLGLNSSLDNLEQQPLTDTSSTSPAAKALAAGLRNPATVRQAMQSATEVDFAVRRDQSRNPAAPTGDDLDAIERFISAMQRANDVVQVELETAGKSNIEREKGIALARAQAAARAAGRDLTDEERAQVLALASAHATLADRLKDVQQAQRDAAETARYFGNLASSSLADIIVDGKNANEVLDNLVKTLARAALQAAFTGQGPLASLLGFAPAASAGPNAVGGLFGAVSSLFRAGGGDVRAGQAVTVGELGREVFVPNQDGKVYPIGKGAAGGGGYSVVINSSPVFQAGMTPTDMASIRQMLEVNTQRTRQLVDADLRQKVANNSGYLT